MKDEIKEILQLIGNCCYCGEISEDKCEKYCNYITNLQTIEREYSSLLSENAELQQENDRLNNIINELEEYCKEEYYRKNTTDIDSIGLSNNIYVCIYMKIKEFKENNNEQRRINKIARNIRVERN